MIYLSLFNGISAGRLAADRSGMKFDKYYVAEIDKWANKVSERHYPDNIQLGDVTKWREWDIDWSQVSLVTAGFPCQAWSTAGKQMGDKDPRGALFWTTLEIIGNVLKHNPDAKFMLENVKMKKEFEEYITHHTEQALGGVTKTLINSSLVSAQNRNRYYWTNFEVTQPDNRGVYLKDILVDNFVTDRDKSYCIDANYFKGGNPDQYFNKSRRQIVFCGEVEVMDVGKMNSLTTVQKDNVVVYRPCEARENAKRSKDDMIHIADATDIKGNEYNKRVYDANGKSPTLSTCQGGHLEPKVAVIQTKTYNRNKNQNCVVYDDIKYRKLTPTECARLQTFPDGWCESVVSNTQAYKCYGNAWTVDVIAHIFSQSGL